MVRSGSPLGDVEEGVIGVGASYSKYASGYSGEKTDTVESVELLEVVAAKAGVVRVKHIAIDKSTESNFFIHVLLPFHISYCFLSVTKSNYRIQQMKRKVNIKIKKISEI